MLAAPQPPVKPQQASQQAAGGSCAATSPQPAWAATAPASGATQPSAPPLQLLPGFHLWLCMGRPSLQLFWQPGAPWVAGFNFAPGQLLPVMAAPSQEALAAAASAQGLMPLDPVAAAAAAVNQSIAAAAMAAQQLPQPPPQPAAATVAGGCSAAPEAAAAGDGEAAAGGEQQALGRASSADSLSCSEQLSQGLGDTEAAGQQAESTEEQLLPMPGPVVAPLQPPSKRKRSQEAEAQPSTGANPAVGGAAGGQACTAPALPTSGPAATAASNKEGGPAAKRRAMARAAAEQAAAARAVGLATAAGKQSPQPSWLLQPAPAAAGPTSAPSPAEAAAEAEAALAAAQAAAAARAAAAPQGAAVQQPGGLAAPEVQHPAVSHESHSWQQLGPGRSASPATTAAAAEGNGAPAAVAAELAPCPGLPPLPALRTARVCTEGQAAAEQAAAAGQSAPAAEQCSEDEMAAAEMLQALAAAAGSGSTALEPLSPLSPQRGAPGAPAPELSSLSCSRSALHAHLQPCGTAIEATAPTWVTFHLPADALGGSTSSVTPVRCRFLFQKPLSASDAGRLGRMVMPRCAEHYLPQPEGPEGLWLEVMDPAGRRYQWLLKFWLSHTQSASGGPAKRTYVFEGCRPFQLAWQVAARTTLAFYQLPGGGYLVDPHAVESHFNSA